MDTGQDVTIEQKIINNGQPLLREIEPISLENLIGALLGGYGENSTGQGKSEFQELLTKFLKQEINKHHCASVYNILILFDNTTLIKSDSDQIYRAVNKFNNKKPLLLVLQSKGGDPGSAYLMGKLCQEFSNNKFVVVVPRYAKSAATLLACAASEIHMGSLSELGPIDPQIDKMPALGLKNSIEHLADLVSKKPGSAEMFSQYLKLSIDPVQIGYYERVAESAYQYAQRLLKHNKSLDNKTEFDINEIAKTLVYDYKDHGFVIDKSEAATIFGNGIVKCNTEEYQLGNMLYNIFDEIEDVSKILNYKFYFIGSVDSIPGMLKEVKMS